jgi:hypothetical protein
MGSLLVVRLTKTRSKALCTLNKVLWLAHAYGLSTTLSKQLISHISYIVKRGRKSS